MRFFLKIFYLVILMVLISLVSCKNENEYRLGIVVPIGEGKVISAMPKEKITDSSTDSPYIISGVYQDSPAYRAGLRPDDVIVQIDGVDLLGLKHDYVYKELVLGKSGSTARFLIERSGEKMIIVVTRGK